MGWGDGRCASRGFVVNSAPCRRWVSARVEYEAGSSAITPAFAVAGDPVRHRDLDRTLAAYGLFYGEEDGRLRSDTSAVAPSIEVAREHVQRARESEKATLVVMQ